MRYKASKQVFRYKNHNFHYCIDSHNTRGFLTERVVEIPLLDYALTNMDNCIEIGCVSPYYWSDNHEIYDLTDTHPSCKNINAKNIKIKNRNIVSVSTIEHFDIDDYNIDILDRLDPIHYLEDITNYSNKYFITFPLGYNLKLTNFILNTNLTNIYFIARKSDNLWYQIDKNELTTEQLAYNTHIWYANSIVVMENIF